MSVFVGNEETFWVVIVMLVGLEICCTAYPYSMAGAIGMGNAGVELSPLLDVAPDAKGIG